MDWLQVGATVLGSGGLSALVGLRVKLALDRTLAKEAADLQKQLEVQKALLQRSTRVHEWQVERLCKLYSPLCDVQAYLQRILSPGLSTGEKREAYPPLLLEALKKAEGEFVIARLLLPTALAVKVDEFFRTVLLSRLDLGAAEVMPAGLQRGAAWTSAQEKAYKELPALLREIEAHSRRIIHGNE